MRNEYKEIVIKTKGFCDMHDLSGEIAQFLQEISAGDGLLTVIVPGSTAGITTIEYEPGLRKDMEELMEKLVPIQRYHHDSTWGDGNGFSHLRASLIGPSITVPIRGGTPVLGTWQQVVLIDFDNRSRSRRVLLHYMGN